MLWMQQEYYESLRHVPGHIHVTSTQMTLCRSANSSVFGEDDKLKSIMKTLSLNFLKTRNCPANYLFLITYLFYIFVIMLLVIKYINPLALEMDI